MNSQIQPQNQTPRSFKSPFTTRSSAKNKIFTFLGLVLIGMSLIPIKNLMSPLRPTGARPNPSRWEKESLYNFDFVFAGISERLYPHGVSLDSEQSMIGKQGWFFLGDRLASSITHHRTGLTPKTELEAQETAVSLQIWQQWLKTQGIRVFRVLLGPDKDSIYPEYLPNWAQAIHQPDMTDELMAQTKGIYIDPRADLIQAKSNAQVYYQLDTHWNSQGAWIAFRALTKELSTAVPGKWLTDADVRFSFSDQKSYDVDLARFLHLENKVVEPHRVVQIERPSPIEIEQYDFETGKKIESSGNPVLQAPQKPLHIKSRSALNRKKVLWLRDSFGNSIAPFMAATFTDVLQVHYGSHPFQRLQTLVKVYQPDYVLMTVVERDSRQKFFSMDRAIIPDKPQP